MTIQDPPGAPPGQQGGRRPPTIDLTAAEVASDRSPPRWKTRVMAWLPPTIPWPLAAAAGAVLLLLLLGLAGVFSNRVDETAPMEARLQRLEQQVRELAAKPAPTAAVDSKALDELT